MKLFLRITALFGVLLVMSSGMCSEDNPSIPVSSVTVSPISLTLLPGETARLNARISPSDATDVNLSWSSSAPSVAKVSPQGDVTAVSVGTATIIATAGGVSGQATVIVKGAEPEKVEVTSVTLNKNSLSLIEGDSETLTATVSPENATDKTVSWSSSDAKVATVDQEGKVTAMGAGNATITAAAGEKKATCSVNVSKKTVEVTGITLDRTEVSLLEGETTTLIATVTPSDATDKTVSWSSSNAQVATVDQQGKVTAVMAGSANITATAGGKTATCAIRVSNKTVEVTGISLNRTEVSLFVGETTTLEATVTPSDATDKTVNWSSSDARVATVDQQGKVTAVGPGGANITAIAGGKSASCFVRVSEQTVAVTGVSLDRTEVSMTEGETTTLVATVTPSDASDKTVTWSSSNAQVAIVDQQGKATATGPGAVIITAKAGVHTANCLVTVKEKEVVVTSITLNKTALSLKEGERETLVATVLPENAKDRNVTWSSSNPSVAVVSQSGEVTALAQGSATVTATAGGLTASCSVTVAKQVVAVTGLSLDRTSATVTVGQQTRIIPIIYPENATDQTVEWTSSNKKIATVEDGVVTGISEGSVTIIAKAGNGHYSASCQVTVVREEIPVSQIVLNKNYLSMVEGDSETLVATVYPSNATDRSVTWSTSDPTIASVDQKGCVTAIAEGTAVITATAGEKKTTCTVDVRWRTVEVSGISLNQSSVTLVEGQQMTLVATVTPSGATDKTVTWTTSNSSIVSVTQNGVITAHKEGSAVISASAGNYTASCSVTVKNNVVEVSGISLNKTSLTLTAGESETLYATVYPSNAVNSTVTWSSTNAGVVVVDQNGKVTAVATGTATIIASAGGKNASCQVTVQSAGTSNGSAGTEGFNNGNVEW